MFERYQTIRHAPMRNHTTLRLGGPADWLVTPETEEELAGCLAEARAAGMPVTVIGQGSNLLVLDGGIRGAVIRTRGLRSLRREGNRITAGCGVMMGTAAGAALEAGLTGLEFASGIPGTVGGGTVMNAGAYGGEMSQVVRAARIMDRAGAVSTWTREQLDFGYRHSGLQGREEIVTEVTFELTPGNPKEIRETMARLNRQRAEKQPLDQPSAGSTFKRPQGGYAAALIDQCGLKGFAVGGASVSEKHAGFLVNQGDSAADYLELVREVQRIVLEKTGIRLEPEIRIIGEEAPAELND